MYKILDINYDKDQLLELFRTSEKDISKKNFVESAGDLINNTEIARLLELYPFISVAPSSIGLVRLMKDVRPYINEGNNGMIIFPIYGKLDFRFYSYEAPVVNGRPSLSPEKDAVSDELKTQIETMLSDTIIIDKPTIINGLIPHSYHIHNNQNPLFLVFKIPLDVSWEAVTSATGA